MTRRKSRTVMMSMGAALAASSCATGGAGTADDWLSFATLERPLSPNTALACSPEICTAAESSRAPLRFSAPPEAVLEALQAIAPKLEIAPTDPDGRIRARYVATTAIMRFKDDVDVMLVPEDDGAATAVMVYSRSRVGFSDLGKNASRINSLEAGLRERLGG